MAGLKKLVDWDAIQMINVSAVGIKSLGMMAPSISHVSIKRADKEGWSRDLVERIKVATQAPT